jgi:hypothetical protein
MAANVPRLLKQVGKSKNCCLANVLKMMKESKAQLLPKAPLA